MRNLLRPILLTALLMGGTAVAEVAEVAEVAGSGDGIPADINLDFERSGFGTSALPIWSELGAFESLAISRMPSARAGDADALLALYLLASGEPVTLGDYYGLRDEIDSWIAELPLSGGLQPATDAHRLFVSMHSRYLGTDLVSNDMPAMYREEQSQLSRVFSHGEFNCISSAMLYVVAARKLDLPVDGVVLPSHAFVQLRLPGRTVEVETTSFTGFDVPHDEAFYSADYSDWFSARSLAPPTYEDYLDRDIVSPYELGIFNMINQHTAEAVMPYRDRMRLAELRGYYRPWDESAQKSRLAYYYQEYVHLREQQDFPTALRMYRRLGNYLEELSEQRFDDDEIPVLLTAVQAQMADTLVKTGDEEAGLALARHLLQTREFPDTARTVESHLFSVVSRYAVDRAEQADYPGARLAFNALEFQCLQNRVCNSGLAQVYSAWAMHYVEDRDWERSADVYREYLLLDSSSSLSEHFSTNLERVYLNWAAHEEWNGEWETAMALLNQCTQLLNQANECESALAKLDAKRDEGFL
ncbi:MAG: transglutaminase family protein [Halieaceae bacterium]|nr:transglutaminase family protein [Halieaceae bacterium]